MFVSLNKDNFKTLLENPTSLINWDNFTTENKISYKADKLSEF